MVDWNRMADRWERGWRWLERVSVVVLCGGIIYLAAQRDGQRGTAGATVAVVKDSLGRGLLFVCALVAVIGLAVAWNIADRLGDLDRRGHTLERAFDDLRDELWKHRATGPAARAHGEEGPDSP